MVKSQEIKAAWDRRETKRKGRVSASKPSALPPEFTIRTPSAANILSILLGDNLPKDLPFMVRDTSIRMEGRPLKPAFVVDELTGVTGINADFIIWDEVAKMEAGSKEPSVRAFAKIASATAQTTRAFASLSETFAKVGKTSMAEILDMVPTGGFRHGELSILSGRQTGKSALVEQYKSSQRSHAATVMTPEQIERNRVNKLEADAERAAIEAEREQLGYGGW